MSKICPKCSAELSDDVNFCVKCGADLNASAGATETSFSNATTVNASAGATTNAAMIQKREIVTAILLSLVTCGIYGIYWFVVMTDDANKVNNENGTTGGMALLFTLLTCGLYSIYWNYKMGQRLYEAGQKQGKNINDNSILYLVLSLLGLGIVNYCLIQSDLNKFAE